SSRASRLRPMMTTAWPWPSPWWLPAACPSPSWTPAAPARPSPTYFKVFETVAKH
ncbi:hypothetical protein ABPG77_002936, partial [Micractinium sp. CCAP 211/92]